MTAPLRPEFKTGNLDDFKTLTGDLALIVSPDGKLDPFGRRVNSLMRGALKRYIDSDAFAKLAEGDSFRIALPYGMAADAVSLIKLDRKTETTKIRAAGAKFAKTAGKHMVLATSSFPKPEELVFGAVMRSYSFDAHKTAESPDAGSLLVLGKDAEVLKKAYAGFDALAEGVFFTRDLVNEPANILTTSEFAARLEALEALGVKVKTLDEDEMAKMGMGALLGVGQGSLSPSKIVIMEWMGGSPDSAPFALVGKGVVFDTGGISLKPAGGMEDMTMDMGGAGVVAGTMKALALRKAPANVVGLVGLVENMPDAMAQRPGDVVTSMKGDTIEVINTDAEGRLVLADVLWYAQETYKPSGVINLATLTGAIIIGLGHENAGVFSNDDKLCNQFLKSAGTEGEGAWRMPLGQAYDDMLKSRIADMKNIGGRPAGSITAAQFLQRFIQEGTPWIHLDIAGVASVKSDTSLAPKGATGWGVLALNRLIADHYQG